MSFSKSRENMNAITRKTVFLASLSVSLSAQYGVAQDTFIYEQETAEFQEVNYYPTGVSLDSLIAELREEQTADSLNIENEISDS